jgi:hypothetical protein
VTTLIAELMRLGVIDAVTTSSAVVSHEMGGTLDKVKRFQGHLVGIEAWLLPRSGEFELTVMDDETLEQIARYMPVDMDLIERMRKVEGKTIIKAAGNLGYPVGLWLEQLSREINELAHSCGASFEEVAGLGADERTMIGMGARKGLPVLVTVPQLIGGGCVGLHIGDSISICERATRLARMLDNADVIIESAVALTQEVHDGPLERYTGHGLWSAWQGHYSFSLEGKKLIRIDLDPTLDTVCKVEREEGRPGRHHRRTAENQVFQSAVPHGNVRICAPRGKHSRHRRHRDGVAYHGQPHRRTAGTAAGIHLISPADSPRPGHARDHRERSETAEPGSDACGARPP